MARKNRLPPASVVDHLIAAPQAFDLLQAVRVLEASSRKKTGEVPAPDRPAIIAADLDLKAVCFVSDVSLRYPGAAITRAELSEDGYTTHLAVSLLGLIGPLGVLPFSYTTHAIDGVRSNNGGLSAFLDIFHHRAVTLFCRAASKYRLALAHGQCARGRPDTFTTILRGLTGIGTPATTNRLAVPDLTILYYAGLFSGQIRSLVALETMLSNELRLAASVEPFVGRWVEVPPAEQTRLGGGHAADGQHTRLGVSTMIGARVWITQQHCRIKVGPVDEVTLRTFLPGTPHVALIADIVRLFCGMEISFELKVEVEAVCVPAARLSRGENDFEASRLGQIGWLLHHTSTVSRTDTTVPIDAY